MSVTLPDNKEGTQCQIKLVMKYHTFNQSTEVGERSVLDVLTARQSLLNSEIKYFQEQKDREITKAQVMYMSGILNLSSLGIN